ncbi:hypothetical protein DRJ17_03540 [Candidatus Woesearchaeota archaeon]|nr:MAG: hypothetical protein DRJ17_03540 [Candidatus Woesearchaeota archaeon]
MVLGIQIIGFVFAVAMIYFTYLYFRRRQFDMKDFIIWLIVWILLVIAVLIPSTVNIFLESLGIVSAIQLFAITGVLFLLAVVFFLHKSVRTQQKKLNKIVKAIALEKVK